MRLNSNNILTTLPKNLVRILYWIKKLIKVLPFGALALVVLGKVAYLLLNEVLFVINSLLAYNKGGNKELKRYWKSNPIMNDKKLNVVGQYTLNAVMISGEVEQHLKFGCEFSTVSDQMGRLPKMTPFGVWCKDVFLDTIEDEHCAKAVQLNNAELIKRVKELNLLLKTNDMNTIAEIRAAFNAMLDNHAAALGENTTLTTSQKSTIAKQADAITETVDPNLPPRPHA